MKSYSFGDSYDDDFDDFDNRFNDDYSDPDLIPFSFGKTTGTGSNSGFEKSSAARSSTTFGGRSVSGTNPGFGRDISELLNRRGTAAGSTTGRVKGSATGSTTGRATGTAAGASRGAATPNALGHKRLKAVNVKPHTDDAKKPYIAKTSAGKSKSLSGLKKGMPAPAQPDYNSGDRVRHVRYGDGTVKALEKTPRDYKVTVQFDECGQKIMYAGFAKLRKL